jgi:hypothetical protein
MLDNHPVNALYRETDMVRHSEMLLEDDGRSLKMRRATRSFFSVRRVLLGVLGVIAGVAVTVLNGGLSAIGREIIEKSQIIQGEIDVLQHRIEDWMPRWRRPDYRAQMVPDELERFCTRWAMSAMPTEGLPGFIEKKGYCLGKTGAPHAL